MPSVLALSFLGVGIAAALGYGLFFGLAVLVGAATLNPPALLDTLSTTLVLVPLLLLVVGVPEELVFRRYLQHLLGQRLATMTMIAAQAGLYAGILSVINWSFQGVFTAFLTGVGLGYLRLCSGGLWGVLGFRIVMTTALVLCETLEFQLLVAPGVWNLAGNAAVFILVLVVGNLLRPPLSGLLLVCV